MPVLATADSGRKTKHLLQFGILPICRKTCISLIAGDHARPCPIRVIGHPGPDHSRKRKIGRERADRTCSAQPDPIPPVRSGRANEKKVYKKLEHPWALTYSTFLLWHYMAMCLDFVKWIYYEATLCGNRTQGVTRVHARVTYSAKWALSVYVLIEVSTHLRMTDEV